MEDGALAEALRRHRPDRAATEGPMVSIVVTNRDGERHLRRFLDGLDRRTSYRSFEVVLVDNGSSDGSVECFRQWSGPGRVVQNTENRSFSAANNQGIAEAAGELVLLANNDIDPIHTEWLGYMVESLDDGVAAVGAMLVYPRRRRWRFRSRPAHRDHTIQHLGIAFERSGWGVRAENLRIGDHPLSIDAPGRRQVPAVTAACLLARAGDLRAAPLDERYWYGSEDWDLCMRLAERGSIVVDERAVLFHHEYGTQDRTATDEWREIRHENHRWFNERWGCHLSRKLRSEAAEPRSTSFFRSESPTVLLPEVGDETLVERLGAQAAAAGWTVTHDERATVDMAIACGVPRFVHRFAGHDASVALVLDDHEHWARSGTLDAAKLVLAPDRIGHALIDVVWGRGIARTDRRLSDPPEDFFGSLTRGLAPRPEVLRIGLSTAAPSWEEAEYWGDVLLARGLMRALRRRGHETTEIIRPDWRRARAVSCDVVIHLRGLHRRSCARGQRNMLWIISHPERVEPDECDDFDIIASASRPHAEHLAGRLGRPVHFLPQASDSDTFSIGARDSELHAPVLYVGSARWPSRRAPRWMVRNGRPFHLYGRNWEDFPEGRVLRGHFIANRDLAAAYRSADIVVADHHDSMRTGGFVANRLFDVLASGGLVLSDDVVGLAELFDDLVPTYSNAHELESQITHLLADGRLRRQLAADGRRIVESRHTLDHRADELLRLLDVS